MGSNVFAFYRSLSHWIGNCDCLYRGDCGEIHLLTFMLEDKWFWGLKFEFMMDLQV